MYPCEAITTGKIVNTSSPQKFPVPLCNSSFLPDSPIPRHPLTRFLSLWVSLRFLDFYINGIIQNVLLFVCLFSLSRIILRSVHVFVCFRGSFLFIVEQCSTVWLCYALLVHLPVDEHLDCFSYSLIINKAAVTIHVWVFLRTYAFISLG